MSVETKIFLFAFLSGITVFLGGLLGRLFNARMPEGFAKHGIIHTSIAFGGGIILSAVALVLVPRGLDELSLIPFILSFLGGALVFYWIDGHLAAQQGRSAQLMAMLMDFIPESIALGAVFSTDPSTGMLLALFIGVQNLPEAFNSYSDLLKGGFTASTILIIFFFISFSGVAGAFIGFYELSGYPALTAHLMTFASGGILYLIFQDIAPQGRMDRSGLPALGATLGFVIGVIGEKLL